MYLVKRWRIRWFRMLCLFWWEYKNVLWLDYHVNYFWSLLTFFMGIPPLWWSGQAYNVIICFIFCVLFHPWDFGGLDYPSGHVVSLIGNGNSNSISRKSKSIFALNSRNSCISLKKKEEKKKNKLERTPSIEIKYLGKIKIRMTVCY